MKYTLKKDSFGSRGRAIAVYVEQATPTDYLGSFNEAGEFRQSDYVNFTVEDCRLIVRLADEIQAVGFDKKYQEAEDDSF